jgi:hypothetical protein
MPILGTTAATGGAPLKELIDDRADGIGFDSPPHLRWLRLPDFDVSLWWGLSPAFLVPCFWILQHRRRDTVGFPVEAVGRDELNGT